MKKLCLTLVLVVVAGTTSAGEFVVPKAAVGELIPDQYLVTFTPGAASGNVVSLADQLAATHGARILYVYNELNGAAYAMNDQQAQAMARNPNVKLVEQAVNFTINAAGNQANPPTYGIDRVDEHTLPLDNNYHWDFSGQGVRIYMIDTGIRTTHVDFSGRASWGTDCTGEGQNDGNGHGTHTAGTAGSETYGVAKDASLIAVKVCTSAGSCPSTAIACGINFVINQKNANPSIPAVANMSLGGPFSQTSNNNVASGVAAGVFFAVAAGNESTDACTRSPASEPTAFTLGSSTQTDARSSFSNFGTCVDVFAPGSSITSTWNTSNTATNTISGTSMASPHAAGAAALVLEQHPTWTPAQVSNELIARATSGVLSGIGTGSPNLLLYTLDDGAPPPPPPPPPPTCSNELHFADFESGGADGWTQGNDTCTTGHFVVGNPDGVNNGGVQTQPSGAATGTGAFFTAPNTGGAGTDDVDGGTCEALSPAVSASGTVTISLDYFHGQRDAGDDSTDGFVIDVLRNGAVVDTLVSFGDVTSNAVWTGASTSVSAGTGSTIQLRVRATDGAAAGDLVEGGVDNVQICGDAGTPPPPPPPPPPGGCTVDDDFETSGAAGWSNSAASTCTTGDYVLGNPTLVSNGGVVTQIGGSNSGVNSIFTAVNTAAGTDDVDGGNCILDSPTWSVANASTLSVAYWHGQRDAGDDPLGDFFVLEYSTNGGASWNTLASNGDSTSNASWGTATAQIPGGSTVALRVQCSDGPAAGDLVECGIDDVSICDN